jgi:hypothetical protein
MALSGFPAAGNDSAKKTGSKKIEKFMFLF